MVSYQYTYIIGVLIGIVIWFFFYIYRKDTRKEMLVVSLIFGVAGPLSEYVYIQDWWKPLTITRTPIGIEDFLFGFMIGGVSAVIYSILFNKKVKIKKVKKIKEQKRNLNLSRLLILLAIVFIFGFFILKLNSFISTILAFVLPIAVIYIKRKDLIKDSLISGFSTLVLAIILYQILNLITPGFFDEFWLFRNIPRILVIGIPLEEIVWFFLAGALMGPLYEYWKEGKLINVKT